MERKEFERLYEEHAQPLYAFLVYRTRDQQLAEDVLADTFVRVLRTGWPFDRRKASQKTWVYSIALNILRDHYRREEAERRAMQRRPVDTAERVEEVEPLPVGEREELAEAMAALSEDEREAIALRYTTDLEIKEIAKLTRSPVSTVEARIYRALGKLRDRMEQP
jgi:RNA polymerase sigma-70 factor (ECF subfamily)